MTNKELGEAIKRGLEYPGFRENKFTYLDRKENSCIVGCALGAALLGMSDNPLEVLENWIKIFHDEDNFPLHHEIANMLDISLELEERITHYHSITGVSALGIAEMLENGEFD